MANNSGKGSRAGQRGTSSNKRSDEGSGMRAQGNERSQQDDGRGNTGRSGSRSGGSGNGGRSRKGSRR